MKLIKLIVILLTIVIFIPGSFSQEFGRPFSPGISTTMQTPGFYNPFYEDDAVNKDKLDFNFTAMSSFSSFSSYGNVFSNTLSPSLSYKVSRKFSVQGGVSISHNYFNSQNNESPYSIFPGTGHSTIGTVWVRGNYLINEKLSVSATGYKQFSIYDKTDNPYYNYNGIDNKGLILDVNYRPSKNVFINARFEYNKGNRPYYNNYWMGQDPISPFAPW